MKILVQQVREVSGEASSKQRWVTVNTLFLIIFLPLWRHSKHQVLPRADWFISRVSVRYTSLFRGIYPWRKSCRNCHFILSPSVWFLKKRWWKKYVGIQRMTHIYHRHESGNSVVYIYIFGVKGKTFKKVMRVIFFLSVYGTSHVAMS